MQRSWWWEGEEREEEGKPLQLSDKLASYETHSYIKVKQRRTEMWDVVARGWRSSFSSHLSTGSSGKKHKCKKSRCFWPQRSMFGPTDALRNRPSSSSAARWRSHSQPARTQIPRLRRRQAVNIFIKCNLASICRYVSLMWPSGAGHQRTGWMPGTAGIMKANACVSECTERR